LPLYFLRLETVGFGGPIALTGYMQRDLVEDRGWITKDAYLEDLAPAHAAQDEKDTGTGRHCPRGHCGASPWPIADAANDA
jgi:hypothetical protein